MQQNNSLSSQSLNHRVIYIRVKRENKKKTKTCYKIEKKSLYLHGLAEVNTLSGGV